MSKTRSKPTMTDVLRGAIDKSGLSLYRIAADTGIVGTCLLRFVRGETSMRLDLADVLAEYLGLTLVGDPEAVPPQPTPENLARPMLRRRRNRPARGRATRKAR